MEKHTVKSYDAELNQLKQLLSDMGRAAVGQFSQALEALVGQDVALAETISERDGEIDQMQTEVDELTVRMLAMRQPMAVDLRVIFSGQKIALSLERVADYAANIARHVQALDGYTLDLPIASIRKMGDLVLKMLRGVLEAYDSLDPEAATAVWHEDDELDRAYSDLLEVLRDRMTKNSDSIPVCSRLLFVARCCERIGDHVTNIAESVYYIATGSKLYHTPPC